MLHGLLRSCFLDSLRLLNNLGGLIVDFNNIIHSVFDRVREFVGVSMVYVASMSMSLVVLVMVVDRH